MATNYDDALLTYDDPLATYDAGREAPPATPFIDAFVPAISLTGTAARSAAETGRWSRTVSISGKAGG